MTGHLDTSPRVLLATDGSPSARVAEAWVDRLRWSTPPLVDVVTVASRGSTRLGWDPQVISESVRGALERIRRAEVLAAQRVANEAGEHLQGRGRTIRSWAREGDCPEELLAAIDEARPDLVVLGPRGQSGLAAGILGSVTVQVVSHVDVPILVARQPDSGEGPLPRHALALVDGSPAAEQALVWLRGSEWLAGGRLTLLGLVGRRTGLKPSASDVGEVVRLIRPEAEEILERLAAPFVLGAGCIDLQLRDGHPLEAALEAAEALAPDLLVVARPHLRPGQPRLAERVAAHAAASVLLVTAGPARAAGAS